MTLDPQVAVVLGVLAAAGAVLGAAVAHWQRGRSMMITGAVIGMIVLPIVGYGAMLYAGVLIVLAVIGGLVTLGLGFIAG